MRAASSTNHSAPADPLPGSRAKIISELRETQRQSQIRHEDTSPSLSPAYIRKPGLLSMELITTCVEYFFTNLYPTQPILHRQKVGETIGMMEVDLEAYCLVVSLCAYMLIQPNIQSSEIVSPGAHPGHDRPQPALLLGPTLLQEATRVRKSINYHESPTVWSVMTSFFLFGSFFCLDKQNTAWFHLREATTLAHILRLHEESHYSTPDIIENTRRRRLYWLLFVTERAYALQQRRPLSLHATINLPTVDEDPSETVELNGFIHLVNLFKPFDDTFVGLWNKSRNGATPEFFSQLQKQLSDALPIYLRSVESQAVDLRCSQQWLKTMVWQLSISHGFLSSTASDNAMSFKFPIEVSRDLVSSASAFSQHSMEVHGIGLIEKLFDVACTLTDVISCVPYEEQMMGYGPRDYLQQLITLISNLRGGQQKYMPLLLSKINETMPNAPGYNLPLPQPSTSSGTPDMYEGVESGRDTRSGPNSEESTPFGSPPLSVTSGQPNPFPQLARDADLTSPVSAGFPDLGQSIRAGGTGLSTSGSVPMFGDTIFQSSADPSVKYESDG